MKINRIIINFVMFWQLYHKIREKDNSVILIYRKNSHSIFGWVYYKMWTILETYTLIFYIKKIMLVI